MAAESPAGPPPMMATSYGSASSRSSSPSASAERPKPRLMGTMPPSRSATPFSRAASRPFAVLIPLPLPHICRPCPGPKSAPPGVSRPAGGRQRWAAPGYPGQTAPPGRAGQAAPQDRSVLRLHRRRPQKSLQNELLGHRALDLLHVVDHRLRHAEDAVLLGPVGELGRLHHVRPDPGALDGELVGDPDRLGAVGA